MVEYHDVDSESSMALRKAYRHALAEVGLSPDSHVFDLNYDRLLDQGGAEGAFLADVVDFYLELDDFSAKIFLFQILEKGRHYPFWWLSYTNNMIVYQNKYAHLICQVDSHFASKV